MTARVLVVDDIDFNVKLLNTRLKQEYYTVFEAINGKQAIEKVKQVNPDIILMDIMMPEMDGFEATKIIKNDPETEHIPIVMVTALNAQEDRVKGLECGADDFLTKPINDTALFARIKSLVRLKTMFDELRLRDKASQQMGITSSTDIEARHRIEGAKVLLIEDDVIQSEKIKDRLKTAKIEVDITENLADSIAAVERKDYHLIMVSTLLVAEDGLRLCSELRSQDKARNIPVLILVDEHDERAINKGLEMGVNDYLITPIDFNEMMARCKTQIIKKNYQDQLKDKYVSTVEQSVKDGLTGLHNRRFFDTHFANLVEQSKASRKDLSVVMVDIDHFKSVNDKYGHQAGDAVLKEVSRRLTMSLRAADMSARYGGEEFVVLLPETDVQSAKYVTERLRLLVENNEFDISVEPKQIKCTASFGLAALKEGDTPDSLLKRADECLYKAKETGRNKFVSDDSV
jgi:two-component system cell cycle response regulator